jgi:inner membrane protein
MDTVTHILLGAVTAQLGFRQRLGAGATWAAAIAAASPDVDVLIDRAIGAHGAQFVAIHHLLAHRGLTHSVLGVPVLALAVAGAWLYLRRRRLRREAEVSGKQQNAVIPSERSESRNLAVRNAGCSDTQRDPSTSLGLTAPKDPPGTSVAATFGLMFLCTLLAAFTHPLLDVCTSYGTEMLLPFSDRRLAVDCIAVVDIFFTPILVFTLLACFLIRRISRGPRPRATLVVGWAGFLLAAAYLAAGGVLHEKAIGEARGLVPASDVVRIDAYPGLGSLFLWRVVIETNDEWIVTRARPLFGEIGPPREQRAPKIDDEWIQRAEALPEVVEYKWFAMGRVRAASSHADGRHIVEFHDMRYAAHMESVNSLWPLHVTFSDDGRLVEMQRVSSLPRETVGEVMGRFWSDIWGR